MVIECPGCHARYRYDEQRFEGKPSKKIRCAKCRQVFDVARPEPAPAVDESASGTDPAGEGTNAGNAAGGELQIPRGKRLSIAILTGNNAGDVFRVEKPRITIGRSDADLTLDDSEASRQHAVLEVRDSVVTLRDLQSRNGTFAAGERVGGGTEIGDKTEFQIGNTLLMLIVTNEL